MKNYPLAAVLFLILLVIITTTALFISVIVPEEPSFSVELQKSTVKSHKDIVVPVQITIANNRPHINTYHARIVDAYTGDIANYAGVITHDPINGELKQYEHATHTIKINPTQDHHRYVVRVYDGSGRKVFERQLLVIGYDA